MATFTPPVQPGVPNLVTNTETRTLEASFGDGYSQRGGDGLNSMIDTIPLTWNALTPAEADQIIQFFRDHKGYMSFDWIPPRELEYKKFICRGWSRQHIDGGLDAISATFQQVFDL